MKNEEANNIALWVGVQISWKSVITRLFALCLSTNEEKLPFSIYRMLVHYFCRENGYPFSKKWLLLINTIIVTKSSLNYHLTEVITNYLQF